MRSGVAVITRIRFDDVLWETSDPKMKGKELTKVQKHINWCANLPTTHEEHTRRVIYEGIFFHYIEGY